MSVRGARGEQELSGYVFRRICDMRVVIGALRKNGGVRGVVQKARNNCGSIVRCNGGWEQRGSLVSCRPTVFSVFCRGVFRCWQSQCYVMLVKTVGKFRSIDNSSGEFSMKKKEQIYSHTRIRDLRNKDGVSDSFHSSMQRSVLSTSRDSIDVRCPTCSLSPAAGKTKDPALGWAVDSSALLVASPHNLHPSAAHVPPLSPTVAVAFSEEIDLQERPR